jgi:hypothetical protein
VTDEELAFLTRTVGGPIPTGRYWLDARGNAGSEGGPAAVNLFQAGRRSSNGGYTWENRYTRFSSSGDGGRNHAHFGPEGLIYASGD